MSRPIGCALRCSTVVLALGAAFAAAAADAPRRDGSVLGAKVYEHRGDFDALFAQWQGIGLNAVFATEPLLRTPGFVESARTHGLAVYFIAPIFFNPEALAHDPDLWALTGYGERAKDDWVEFVCPSREEYRRARVEWIGDLVRSVRPDGVSIDFIRHFVFWETVAPKARLDLQRSTCFCPHCLAAFEADSGIAIPGTLTAPRERSRWIIENHLRRWTEWRCRTITSMVEAVASEVRAIGPQLRLVIHLVPWREGDFDGAIQTVAGQDVAALAPLVDLLSPMCYAHMVRRDSAWIRSVVEDVARRAGGKAVLPAIQVREAYRSERMTAGEFREHLIQALRPPSAGVALWEWPAFEAQPEKQDVLRAVTAQLGRARAR